MKTLKLILVTVLLLAGFAAAQQVTAITPTTCPGLVNNAIDNCVLTDVNGGTVWTNILNGANFLLVGGTECSRPVTTLLRYTTPDNKPGFAFESTCGNFDELLNGYTYQYRTSGRLSHVITRWVVTSGTITVN